MSRAACAGVVLVAALAATDCGGGDDGGSKARPASDPFTQVSREPSLTRTARRAAPRWERVARFAGTAPAAHRVSIARGAIQWRARWRCSSGRLALAVEPAPRTAADKPGGHCPGAGEATWVQTGDQQLRVSGGGRWSVVVEQQVDTPLREPALAAMRAPGDLFVWLSAAARPRTTKQAVAARRLGPLVALKSTIGEQNYVLPRSVDPDRVRSIVIWCEPIQIVYTAAALHR